MVEGLQSTSFYLCLPSHRPLSPPFIILGDSDYLIRFLVQILVFNKLKLSVNLQSISCFTTFIAYWESPINVNSVVLIIEF